MLCPKCDHAGFELAVPCPECGFTGEFASLLRLAQLEFLLSEAESWSYVVERNRLKQAYAAQLQEVEVELGLQEPPIGAEAVQALREERQRLLVVRRALKGWQRAGWLSPMSRVILRDELVYLKKEIEAKLADAPKMRLQKAVAEIAFDDMAQIRFCLEIVDELLKDGSIENAPFQAVRTELEGELERLEIAAGLREPAVMSAQAHAVDTVGMSATADQANESKAKPKAKPKTKPKTERKPWTWDRVWETLLSERTLQAILFMGVALMFAAAVSLVVYNWDTFPPTVQVAFLAGFTALFYGLGWYVRARMNLYGSGIALSAVASLLVPLDFYAFYLSGGFPQERWGEVWLFGSVVSLIIYLIVIFSTQAQFFGYFIGLAAGSLLTASLNYAQIDPDWWQSGLMVLAFGFALSAERLYRTARESAWRILAIPFWRLALFSTIPLLLIGLGLGFLGGRDSRVFFFTLAINWWLAGLLFMLATRRHRFKILGVAAALAFPVAVGLSEYWYFQPQSTPLGWYALGLALLLPIYWLVGWALQQRFWRSEDELDHLYGRQVLIVSGLLLVVAAGWSFANTSAATVVHLLLALFMLLALLLWRQSRLMWGMSLFLLTGTAAWQASRGATPAELALPWGFLSIMHLIIAIRLEEWAQKRLSFATNPPSTLRPFGKLRTPQAQGTGGSGGELSRMSPEPVEGELSANEENKENNVLPTLFEQLSARLREPLTDTLRLPLYTVGLFLAGVAIVPPLLLFDQSLLAYALLNWIGINGWLAYLRHSQPHSALASSFVTRGKQEVARGKQEVARGKQEVARGKQEVARGKQETSRGKHQKQKASLKSRITGFWPGWWQPTLFQWLAALAIVPWWWTNWTNGREPSVSVALGYAILALGLLFLTIRVRCLAWRYGRPWQIAAHLSNMAAFAAAWAYFDQPWTAGILLLMAGFYFMAAPLLYQRYWLFLAALLFPLGGLTALEWWGMPIASGFAAMASVVLGYLLVSLVLIEGWKVRPRLVQPLYNMGFLLGTCMIVPSLLASIGWSNEQESLIWIASTFILLGAGFIVYTWLTKYSQFGHVALWLAIYGAGLLIKMYSSGSGRSALFAALLAVACVLGERVLRQGALLPASNDRSMWSSRLSGAPIRQAWRLFRRPLLFVGWTISVGAIGAALFRNLIMLGGGKTQQLWAIAGLLTITGLYALSARLFKKARFVWFASFLLFFPWTLSVDFVLMHILEWKNPVWYAPTWLMLALGGLAAGVVLAQRLGWNKWSWGTQVPAHFLVAFLALIWSLGDISTASITFGLGVLFYLVATWIDRRFQAVSTTYLGRFLYPTAMLVPIWVLLVYDYVAGNLNSNISSLIMLAFVLPMLWVGRRLEWWERTGEWMEASILEENDPVGSRPYSLGLYVPSYTYYLFSLTCVLNDRPLMVGVLFFGTALMVLSAYLFRERRWLYIGTLMLPLAVISLMIELSVPENRFGWAFIALGAGYLTIAWLLQHARWAHTTLYQYSQPFLHASFVIVAVGLIPSSQDNIGMIVGYGAAAVIYLVHALWLRRPVFSAIAAGLAVVPYWVGALELGLTSENDGLALWPGILVSLLFARLWHNKWTKEAHFETLSVSNLFASVKNGREEPLSTPSSLPSSNVGGEAGGGGGLDFPWFDPFAWPSATVKRIFTWWPFPLYLLGFAGLLVSPLLAFENKFQLCMVLGLGSLVYLWSMYRFKRRGWLLLASIWLQLAALAFIRWTGWAETPAQVALAFMPITVLTAGIALLVEYVFDDGLPLLWGEESMLRFSLNGWSRPLYALLVVDILFAQLATLISPSNGIVTLTHVFILSIFAVVWNVSAVAYLPMVLGIVALMQRLRWIEADFTQWPIALAWLALAYGVIGYGIRFWQERRNSLHSRTLMWQEPLQRGGWLVSILALIMPLQSFPFMVALVSRTLFYPAEGLQPFELAQIEMFTLVFAVTGLLYLTAALVERKRDWGYGALFLLLCSWSVWLLLLQGQRELQLYALPASLYLLGLGWLEWEYGNRRIAVWVDRLGLLLLFGSIFGQSFGINGNRYAFLMIIEGLLIAWLGSFRRLRRFLYAGVTAVILAVISQLIDPLFELDTFVLLLLGGSLLALAIALERRLEEVRILSKELRLRLENWD